jgi:hypothetical protein
MVNASPQDTRRKFQAPFAKSSNSRLRLSSVCSDFHLCFLLDFSPLCLLSEPTESGSLIVYILFSFHGQLRLTPVLQRPQGRAPEGLWVHDKAPIAPAALLAAPGNTKLLVSNLHYEISPKDLTVRQFLLPHTP